MPHPSSHPRSASSPSTASFQTLTIAQVQSDLMRLYQKVACENGRVEIVDPAGECDCVLISKVELETLENALRILADSDGVREVSASLAELAQCMEPEHAGV